LFSGFVTIGRYGKWLRDVNLLLILIRQMAALVRRALAEVCTVPVLLVYNSVNKTEAVGVCGRSVQLVYSVPRPVIVW